MNTNPSPPAWRTLGELELPIGVSTEAAVHAWLMELLAPFSLSSEFMARVLSAARAAVGRAFQSESTLSHIHLLILVPRDHVPAGKSWGFFHIEKIEPGIDSHAERHHAIDLYLYVEGE